MMKTVFSGVVVGRLFLVIVLIVAGHQSIARPVDSVPATGLARLVSEALPDSQPLQAQLEQLAVMGSPAPVLDDAPLSLVLLSYHQGQSSIRDLVVQVFRDPQLEEHSVLNPDGIVRMRLGDDLFGSADQFMELLYHPVTYFGSQTNVARQQRAFEAGIAGDLTFLRENTIDPLRFIAILPAAGKYLPRSLRDRVSSIVVDSTLSFGEWTSQITFVAPDDETARQVGFVVSAWRELATYLADSFAAYKSGRQLRDAIRSTTIRIEANRVVSSATIPAGTAVRVTNEFAGYGPPARVTICHRGRTLSINESALPAHLAHGDSLGPCPGDQAGKGNNGIGNGPDPQPPGNPPINDEPGRVPPGHDIPGGRSSR